MAILAAGAASGQSRRLPNDPAYWTLAEATMALAGAKISSDELTRACLERIRRVDPALNAFITRTEKDALARAQQCDSERQSGRVAGPLHGIPIALKDNIDTAGLLTTAASRVFAGRIPAEDAEVTRRLKNAGMVLLGKLNLDEFAFEGTGTTSCYGPVHNPWKLDHITGGSSAGSAAALAAGLCYASVGSDDGGSVRIPGAYCGRGRIQDYVRPGKYARRDSISLLAGHHRPDNPYSNRCGSGPAGARRMRSAGRNNRQRCGSGLSFSLQRPLEDTASAFHATTSLSDCMLM